MAYTHYLIAPHPPVGADAEIIAKAKVDILQVLTSEDDTDFASAVFGQFNGQRCVFVPAMGEAVQKYRRGAGPFVYIAGAEVEAPAEPEPDIEPEMEETDD